MKTPHITSQPLQQRRQLLQAGAAALGTAAVPAWARPAQAESFARAVSGQPLLQPYKGVADGNTELQAPALLRGRWPAELQGHFYRNGPALFERAGQRYHHWFDGDGMVQQFTIARGHVSHRGRLVQTAKLRAEQQAGRFLMSALGTTVEGGPPGTGPDAFNTANTNVLQHGGRLLALWEGGSAHALNAADLSTQGPVTWRADLQQMPFSAHPKVDASGHLWNFGTSGKTIVAWHLDPQGRLASVQLADSPFPGGMVHDMAVTPRYLVLPLPPVQLNFGTLVPEGPRRFALVPGEPLRILVMDKNDIKQRQVFELPAEMLFHVGNAYETPDGQVVLNYIGAPDARFLDQGAVSLMAGQPQAPGPLTLRNVTLNLHTRRAQQQAVPTGGALEFPRLHPAYTGMPTRWLATAAGWKTFPGRPPALLHGVQMVDLHSGRSQRFDYGEHAVAEEHIVVPKPGKSGERDAWLLGTTFDARRQATVLNLLDAAHVADGPIAQAVLPYLLPLGFHGNFAAA